MNSYLKWGIICLLLSLFFFGIMNETKAQEAKTEDKLTTAMACSTAHYTLATFIRQRRLGINNFMYHKGKVEEWINKTLATGKARGMTEAQIREQDKRVTSFLYPRFAQAPQFAIKYVIETCGDENRFDPNWKEERGT